MNAHFVCTHISVMIHRGGAIHQPYLTIWGVQAQQLKLRSKWMAPLSFVCFNRTFRVNSATKVVPVTT